MALSEHTKEALAWRADIAADEAGNENNEGLHRRQGHQGLVRRRRRGGAF
jgi:hypothetical protein